MKGKINCTCGWSWNKSDSSAKDMYICHECGRDNSNNMKNGGWLDNYGKQANYNDSKATASPDMVGDGFSNVGRNYSPAWGGQFEDGGEIPKAQKGKPIYVESKNDPRYKAYQDSLALYKTSLKNLHAEKTKSKANPKKLDFIPFDKFKTFVPNSNLEYNDINMYPGVGKDYIKGIKSNKVDKNKLNKLIKNNIKPIGFDVNQWKGEHSLIPTINYSTIYKKPEEEILIQRPQESSIINSIQPASSSFNLNASVPQIRQQVRQPKYYDIQENINQPFGGSQTNYRTSDLNSITSPDDLGPGNTRNIIPRYQKGGKLKFLQPTSDKLPEGYMKGSSIPSTERAMSIGGENGEPAYLIPSFKYGQELLGPVFDPISEFKRTGEHLGGPFKTWQEADEWERTVRHPAVEKGETIMFPQEKFQTGGAIPGSVGFTYARTKGIPSEGPYAKKTLPSAQNGQEMKFYQEGLDWKPKTISRDGAWLDGHDVAQTGTEVLANKEKALEMLADIQKRKQGKSKPSTEFSNVKIKNERKEAVTKADNTRSKPKLKVTDVNKLNVRNKTEQELAEQERLSDKAIAAERRAIRERSDTNPLNQGFSGFFNSENQTRQNWEDSAAGLESKFRVSDEPNVFDDWINPASWVGRMAANLGAAPNQIVQQDSMMPLVSAIAEPVLGGAIGEVVGPYISRASKAITTPIKETVSPFIKKTTPFSIPEYMSLEAPKGNMYGENQVLTQQQRLLNPDIKAKFFENQAPEFIPSQPTNSLLNFQKTPKDFGNRITPKNYEDFVNRIHGSTDYDLAASAAKKPTNLGVGNYNMPGKVFKDAPLNELGKDIINAHEKNHGIFAGTLSKEMQESLLKPFGTKQAVPHYAGKHQADEVLARMAQFKNAVGIGDNQTFTLGHLNLIRKNYANQFLDNGITEMLAKIKPGSAGEKEFLKNMNKYAFGLTPAAIIGAGTLEKQREGGIIKDDRGQWAHPGEITEIGSNDITMQGVPYPVLGISDEGDTKLMKPGKNYKFKGKKVIEFPMAKNGVNQQDEKTLQHLDQLTNFTNYNKPSGWMDKYSN